MEHLSAKKCVVNGCAGKDSAEIRSFAIPKEDAEAWCENLQISLKYMKVSDRVCSRHFEEKWLGKKKLVFGARPTLNLCHTNIRSPISQNGVRYKPRKCSIEGCNESTPFNTLFSFPKDPLCFQVWVQKCKLKVETENHLRKFICGKHFEETMFAGKKLKKNAIPTLQLSGNSGVPNLAELKMLPYSFDNENPASTEEKTLCTNCHKFCQAQEYYRKKLSDVKKNFEEVVAKHENEKKLLLDEIADLKCKLQRMPANSDNNRLNSVFFHEEIPRRRTDLSRHTRNAQAQRRKVAKRTEHERSLANERTGQKMAQIRAEEGEEARLEKARLGARRSSFSRKSGKLCEQKYGENWISLNWNCCRCHETFASYAILKTHWLTVHEAINLDDNYLHCDDCNELPFSYASFINHSRTAHYEALKLCCDVCNQILPDYAQLSTHREWHNETLDSGYPIVHHCSLCGNASSSEIELKNHIQLMHNSIRAEETNVEEVEEEACTNLVAENARSFELFNSDETDCDFSSIQCKEEFIDIEPSYHCGKCIKKFVNEIDLKAHTCTDFLQLDDLAT